MKLLIIRPEPGASASAQRAATAGFEPVLMPLFEVLPCAWEIPSDTRYDALLISSANAIRHGGNGLERLAAFPVHAVGERSATAARDAGLTVASVGAGGVADVLAHAERIGHRRLLWLTGEDRTALPLAENLSIDVHTVYAARPVALPANAAALIGSCAIVALHSVRAAHRFGEVVDALGLARDEILLAAFSPVVAGSAGDGWGGIAIARHPVDTALLSAAIALVKETEDAPARKAHP